MAETLAPGRKGQLYVGAENEYGGFSVFVSAEAVRHLNFKASRNPFNRATSAEKKQSPGTAVRFDRKETAGWSVETLIRPSGTLNTLPEASEILEAAFGSVTNVTLATTVSASPAPTTTGCTVASAAGLAVKDAILIVVSAVKYVRWLTAIDGAALTWAPALPSAPAAGAAVKGCITYKLTSELAKSLSFGHYLTSDTTHSRQVLGGPVEQLGLVFAQNEEGHLTASGPAKTVTTPAPAKPAAFTTVGGNPPSGITGELRVGAAAHKFIGLDIQMNTGMALRMDTYGESQATELLPRGRRVITMGLNTKAADEAVVFDSAEAGTRLAIHKQTGWTEGNIIGIYAPQVDFDVPDADDSGDDVPAWPFKGVCCESADAANDELYVAFA